MEHSRQLVHNRCIELRGKGKIGGAGGDNEYMYYEKELPVQ